MASHSERETRETETRATGYDYCAHIDYVNSVDGYDNWTIIWHGKNTHPDISEDSLFTRFKIINMFHGLRLTQEFHEQSPQSALLSGVPWERPQSTRIPPLYRKRLTYLRIFFEIIGLHDQKFNTLNMYV